ncbi:MAG TPA: serine hydrolase domain-containing protein [Steroidobacteraceae bacterium]|nr:serine hydrolase domain-containing protein [Steroidobacteraceae bacterium]
MPAVSALLLCLLCIPALAASRPNAAASAQVDALFARFQQGLQPGAGVLVVWRGDIVHEAAYGYADVESKVPLTVDSTFRLDSVSKQFTAMAIMLLAEDGRLKYDDPIARYLPELASYPGITVRNLLNHTGGLPEYYDDIDVSQGWPTNADARKLLGKMAKPMFAPGSRYEYSNPGYDMLAEIVEAASGQKFAAFMRERIFQPLEMQHSLIYDTTKPHVERRVLGYDPDGKGFKLNDEHPLNGIVGAGGVFTTLGDMYLWDQALYGERLVHRATLDQAFTGAVLNDGRKIDYGFGWRMDEYRHSLRIEHGGAWVGFRSHIARHPGIGLTIVILSNRSDFDSDQYIDRITDIYLDAMDGRPRWPAGRASSRLR